LAKKWIKRAEARGLYSQPNPVNSADDIQVTGTGATIILTHVIKIERKMPIELTVDTHGETVAYPVMCAPVVEDLVRGKEL